MAEPRKTSRKKPCRSFELTDLVLTLHPRSFPASFPAGAVPAARGTRCYARRSSRRGRGFTRSFITFANFLFRHNALIGIMMFGLGIVAGVPTLMLLAYQGIIFGAFIALHYNRDLLVDFLGWVSIHGVTEFGAIILCGAGGLVIAQNILFPGRYSRVDNLAAHGRSAAQLAVGAVFMFFIAGLIEGGMRQLVADTSARFCHRGAHRSCLVSVFSSRRQAGATMSAVQDRVSQFLEGVTRSRREILTPEGVVLPVDLADHGERAVALIIDLFIWVCVTALLYLIIIAFVVQGTAVEIAMTLMLFIAFIVRNLYFVYFELAWQGATPGSGSIIFG